MTYEENVRKVAEEIARDYFDKVLCNIYKDEYYEYWLSLHLSSFEHSSRIAVRLKAEGFEAAYRLLDPTVDQIVGWFNSEGEYTKGSLLINHLIERGLIPAPEVNEVGNCEESPMEVLFGEMCERCRRRPSSGKHSGKSVCLSCHNKLAEED